MKRNSFYLLFTCFTLIIGSIIFIINDTSIISIMKYIAVWILLVCILSFISFFLAFIVLIARATWEPLFGIGKYDNDNSGMYMTSVAILSLIALCFVSYNAAVGNIRPELRKSNVLKYLTTTQKVEFLGLCVNDGNYEAFGEKYKYRMIYKSFSPAKETVLDSLKDDPRGLEELVIKYSGSGIGNIRDLGNQSLDILIKYNHTEQLNNLLNQGYGVDIIIPFTKDVEILTRLLNSSPYSIDNDTRLKIEQRIEEIKK